MNCINTNGPARTHIVQNKIVSVDHLFPLKNIRIKQTLFLLACLLASLFAAAQAPTITSQTGLPIGAGKGVAYGNSTYVTIVQNKIYKSATGTSWLRVNNVTVPSGEYNSITFGAGLFVIVGNNGLLFTSPDAVTWTVQTSGTSNRFYDVQFINSNFFAVGENATVIQSADGITWATITMGTGLADDMFMNITFGNSRYVIGCREPSTGNLIIYRSATGLSNSWTKQNLGFETLNRVQYLKDRFYIFTSGTRVYTSTDASAWTNSTTSLTLTLPNATVTNIGTPNQIFHGIYDGSKIYLFGYSGYYLSYGAIYSSTDGVNFTLEPKTAYIVAQGSAYLNNMYFEYGNEGVVSSANGTTYSYPGGNYYGAASSGTAYIGAGMIGSAGILFRSTDFTNWNEVTPSATQALYSVVYDGASFVAAGEKQILSSNDNGNTWSTIATPNSVITAMTYGGTQFVAAGYDATTYDAQIMYSSDAINWTLANSDYNYYFRVKYENGNYFAMGYDNNSYLGVVMHSSNGISWTNITPNLPYPVAYFSDVIYDGTKYHLMGVELVTVTPWVSDDFFSVSTSTLSDPDSYSNKGSITASPGMLGGTFGEGTFAYNNGHYIGSVVDINTNEGYVIYSNNGVNWTAVSLNENTAILGVITEANAFRMLGTNDAKITASYSASSLPVRFGSFTANLVNKQSKLQWSTMQEIDAEDFVIEHSTPTSGWKSIGTVSAVGNSHTTKEYNFTHASPADGMNRYRLLQRDKNGKGAYSKTVVLMNKSDLLGLTVFPNPVQNGSLHLRVDQNCTIRLFTNAGLLVLQRNIQAGSQAISVNHLPAGIYQLQAGTKTTQIVLQ